MPPKAWSAKDERQYKHVRKSEKEQGRSDDRAEEIAAATVNKQRAKEGRTKTASKKAAKKSTKKASKASSRKRTTKKAGASRPAKKKAAGRRKASSR
ncbi:MAG: addiction module toxin RelE [Phycisphaerales bacterium]|nr:addiction module toxin RelE [Phycisphaerales bacterium]